MTNGYIAIDLGAESGRVIVGVLEGERLRLEEVHRFLHEPLWLPTGLHWNITGIWQEIVAGLRRAAEWSRTNRVELASVGADTWGVDWALVGKGGELVGLPHAYRDPRNSRAYDAVLAKLGADRIYRTTGIQFMPLNSLYSLYAHKSADPRAFAAADRMLFMPDLLHYWLSGEKSVEATIASTSQMIDCHTGNWAREMLAELGLPTDILGSTVTSGTTVGKLVRKLADDTGLPTNLQVVTPAAHDTASAVAAVPSADESHWCYLSSGTWSLLGAELDEPCVSAAAQAASFTNELGVGGKFRFLNNIAGLWLVQECRRDFARRGQEFDYPTLTRLAGEAPAFRTLVDPSHVSFHSPGGMRQKIVEFARATDQPEPESPGQFIRCCLESLALCYRDKLTRLESIIRRRFDVMHIVGGGGKNALLSQMTADATGRRMVVGPYEATAMGNVLVQGMANAQVRDLAHLRRIVSDSFELMTYEPHRNSDWDSAADRFAEIAPPDTSG
ncbi:MAG TPA: rhamnulokinase family protein [Lacipirellulaceae bacterium]|nr:rhamnulokinase family protein [Lacipirellulaceae bacterium]